MDKYSLNSKLASKVTLEGLMLNSRQVAKYSCMGAVILAKLLLLLIQAYQ